MSERPRITLTYAVFPDEKSASAAIEALHQGPFVTEEVTVLSHSADGDEIEQVPVDTHTRSGTGGAIGAAIGSLGGIALALAGPWAGAGALLLAVQGALFGGGTGGAVGVLAGLDWEEHEVDITAEHFPPETFLVGVMSRRRIEEATKLLKEAGAEEVFVRTPGEAFEAFSHPDYVEPDVVEEAGNESFPASDPPSWNP